jgi:hypothetical protein
LIAPAIELACPLVTYDERILALAEGMVGNTGFSPAHEPDGSAEAVGAGTR